MTDEYCDGNALAGPLGELFAVDLTAASSRCTGCGRRGSVATLRVYAAAPGLVARCPACDAVAIRVVRTPGRVWLDVHGVIEIALPDEAPTP